MNTNYIEEKHICLSCGDFYPKREMIRSSCIWCSIQAKTDAQISVVDESPSKASMEDQSSSKL